MVTYIHSVASQLFLFSHSLFSKVHQEDNPVSALHFINAVGINPCNAVCNMQYTASLNDNLFV